jgi:hypothetical protein
MMKEFLCEAQQPWHQVGAPPTFTLSGQFYQQKKLPSPLTKANSISS